MSGSSSLSSSGGKTPSKSRTRPGDETTPNNRHKKPRLQEEAPPSPFKAFGAKELVKIERVDDSIATLQAEGKPGVDDFGRLSGSASLMDSSPLRFPSPSFCNLPKGMNKVTKDNITAINKEVVRGKYIEDNFVASTVFEQEGIERRQAVTLMMPIYKIRIFEDVGDGEKGPCTVRTHITLRG